MTIPEHVSEYFRKLEGETGVRLSDRKKAWYVQKEAEQKELMSSEYPGTPEEAFSVVMEGVIYAKLVWRAREEGRVRELEARAGVCVDTAWDLGVNNAMACWLFQDFGEELWVLDCLEGSDSNLQEYAKWLGELRERRGYVYGRFYAPHDISVRDLVTGRSRLERAKECGLYFEVCPKLAVEDGIGALKELFPKLVFDARRCVRLLDALSKYRYEKDARTGMWKREPLHDWTSNFCDAGRVMALCHGLGGGMGGWEMVERGAVAG